MSQKKLLHELLREDQEPFILKKYIADRRRLLKKPSPSNTQVQVRKRKSETSTGLRNHFCGSAFRFVLHSNPSSAFRTPEFSLPPTSPSRHKTRDTVSYDVESLNNLQVEEEEDKEQCSPVSTLDPPFEDDEGEDDGDDLECSSATVERPKQHLPSKLRRFEKLVELDPVELEKRMDELGEEEDDDDDDFEEEKGSANRLNMGQFSRGMKRLIADIIAEEERHESGYENTDEVVRRACKRLESWEEVKTNTIDMMVGRDLRMENEKKMNEEEMRETAMDVELAIFVFLVEELAIELDR